MLESGVLCWVVIDLRVGDYRWDEEERVALD